MKAVTSPAAANLPKPSAKGHGHRHTNGHEHDFEPVRGLPEILPSGEQILWQGAPNWLALAVHAFHLRKLAIYFGLLMVYQAAWVVMGGGGFSAVLLSLAWPTGLAALALGAVALLAYLSARTTVYTITNRRVVMRIGIVLTLAFNLPYARITAAAMKAGSRGHGDISLSLDDRDHIAWLTLWPHARPWKLAKPQPTLRGVEDAAAVAQLLSQQWSQATGRGLAPAAAEVTKTTASASNSQDRQLGQPALATR